MIYAKVRTRATPNLSLTITFRSFENHFFISGMPSRNSATPNSMGKTPLRFLLPSVFKVCVVRSTRNQNSVVSHQAALKHHRRTRCPPRLVSKKSSLPTITEGRQWDMNPPSFVTRAGTFVSSQQPPCYTPSSSNPTRPIESEVSNIQHESAANKSRSQGCS